MSLKLVVMSSQFSKLNDVFPLSFIHQNALIYRNEIQENKILTLHLTKEVLKWKIKMNTHRLT